MFSMYGIGFMLNLIQMFVTRTVRVDLVTYFSGATVKYGKEVRTSVESICDNLASAVNDVIHLWKYSSYY